jgi:hypothetical protein
MWTWTLIIAGMTVLRTVTRAPHPPARWSRTTADGSEAAVLHDEDAVVDRRAAVADDHPRAP